jgi:HPr kinase/phosphorylase
LTLHASAAARRLQGVLLVGPPGSGKSDLLLRLIDRGFDLVADDQVELDGASASAPARLAGLLEIRGLGIARLPFVDRATLSLVVTMERPERLPMPSRYALLDLPMISVDPFAASAPLLVELALNHVQAGNVFVTGAFG